MNDTGVCVIIAAYRASATIGRAIASALAQAETVEVIVIDDASGDATPVAARASDDGSGRLSVVEMPTNGGPSRARNHAIALSTAPLIAVIDADDFFLPGRLAALRELADWDFAADNIALVGEGEVDRIDPAAIVGHRIVPRLLTAEQFVEGSITRPDRYRGELAFLKPVMRRSFLDAHRLRYAENMRLAEDYDLYLRALVAGARFRVAPGCHYVAVERRGSLSGNHRADDLARFQAAIARHEATTPDGTLHRLLGQHRRQIARRYQHRALLQRKRERGLMRALADQVGSPLGLAGAITDVARDKLRGMLRPTPAEPQCSGVRFLIEA